MTADSHARRKFRKLLARNGFELVSTNIAGGELYRLAGCNDVLLSPHDSAFYVHKLTLQVEAECRRKDPELTNESARRQAAWEQEETARLERERADAARVKDLRLGGASKVLTEFEVDRIARHLEREHAERQRMERLMRAKPLAG